MSNESDETQTLTLRFADQNTGSAVAERKLTLKPGVDEEYKVHLAEEGDESSHYVLTVTTDSGHRQIRDLGEGVFYIIHVTVDSDGLDLLVTTR